MVREDCGGVAGVGWGSEGLGNSTSRKRDEKWGSMESRESKSRESIIPTLAAKNVARMGHPPLVPTSRNRGVMSSCAKDGWLWGLRGWGGGEYDKDVLI